MVGCLVEPLVLHRAFVPALAWPMLALVVVANVVRGWCMITLGPRWTARLIVIPGRPLVGSAWITACTFSALNAVPLTVRVRCETRAGGFSGSPGPAHPGMSHRG